VALLPSFLLRGGILLLARGFDGSSSAHVVQKNNFQSHKSKNKNKFEDKGKFDGKNKAS
jgi:hypothetical protein